MKYVPLFNWTLLFKLKFIKDLKTLHVFLNSFLAKALTNFFYGVYAPTNLLQC